jgi:hypothetical protein
MPPPPPKEPIATEPEPMLGKVFHRVLEPDASRIVTAMWGLCADARDAPKFPGPSPVSLENRDLAGLRARAAETYVCEKTDGVRYALVFLTHNGHRVAALVNRRLAVWLCPLRGVPRAAYQGTVIDGELAYNKRVKAHQFVAFDAVCLSGIPVFHARFCQRVKWLHRVVEAMRPEPAADPIAVKVKEFVLASDWPAVLSHARKAAEFFDTDGLVFTPDAEPVRFGRHMKMHKWKRPDHHTVDFLVGHSDTLAVFNKSTHVVVGRLVGGGAAPGQIAECALVGGDAWRAVGVRTDKNTANDMFTYQKTMNNIAENLDLDALGRCFV